MVKQLNSPWRSWKRYPIGTRVRLTAKHPHRYESGTVVGYDWLSTLPHLGRVPRIRLENCEHGTEETYVTRLGQMRVANG
jgi:hypothetical protein